MARSRRRASSTPEPVKAAGVDHLYGEGDQARDQRTHKRRADCIDRFTEAQEVTREWINFKDIADWCAKERHSILPDEKRRNAAFDTLAHDLLAGEFEENGRSRVLYLHPAAAKVRMTREWLKDAIEHNYDGDQGRTGYLAHCWVPRRLFDHWRAMHRLEESPRRFKPLEQSSSALKKPKRGRPAEYNWSGVASQIKAYVSKHGPVQSQTELLQKCADFASDLHPDGLTPSEKAIREAIKRHRLDIAAGVKRRK
jgi:hypothetical protein